jgi:PAS domain S-box-containing protein/putative nucleotidyltransferase with HDIG domain
MKKTPEAKTPKPYRRGVKSSAGSGRPSSRSPASRPKRSAVPPFTQNPPTLCQDAPEEKIGPPKKTLRVLTVEDLEDDAFLMVRELERGGYTVDHQRVETPQAMAQALDSSPWDVVLSDHSMPKFDAPQALDLIKSRNLDLPFLIVSGSIGEDQAVAVMKAGANDYLQKDNLARLLPAVERELREAEIRKARIAAEEALRSSEALYRTLVQTSPDAIVVADPDTRIRMSNPKAQQLLGLDAPEGLPGERLLNFVHKSQVRPIIRFFKDIRLTGQSGSMEINLPSSNGDEVMVELTGSPLPDPAGKDGAMLLVMRDISARKKSELQIRRQLERLAALRTVDAAINASLDLRVTLMVILDELMAQLNVDAADIYLLNPKSPTLRFAAGRGFRTINQKDAFLPLNRGYAGRAALEQRMMIGAKPIEQEDDPARRETLRAEGFITCIAAPLIAKGQVKGVLEVFHRAPLEMDSDSASYLETMAGQAAIAIDNAVLFEDLQRSNLELTLAYDATIEGWSRALDLRDRETEGHTQRVTEATLRLAHRIGIPEEDLVHARRGCLLHDIGKMAIPDSILLKPGELTDAEREIIRQHPTIAFEMLSPVSFLRPTLDIPYCHHERWDGSGYPRGLKGEQIPLAARIFAVVDIWDALRSDRPYRSSWPDSQVRSYLASMEGRYFDPDILRTFMEEYYS